SAQSDRTALAALSRPAEGPPPAPAAPPAGEGPLLLLAEDNPTNIAIVSDYLAAKGYRLALAHDGVDAVRQAAELQPALILMDVQLPLMDGLEAMRRIRAGAATAHIPIIAVTALAMAGDRERCLAAGASDYLSKPLQMSELLRRIELLVGRTAEGDSG
ncbi:MAG TPA: response regulator, partial [Roseiflexaceae bacterium]|nr:response regulator [Roseiflexaceae bacterium]